MHHKIAFSAPTTSAGPEICLMSHAAHNTSTSTEQAVVMSDRKRLWEVRKYCQVRLALGRNDFDGGKLAEKPQVAKPSPSDAALSSLLQLLIDRLDADVAMVSLLDEETQFFLAGAVKDDSDSAIQCTKWFGRDQVSHFDGLCERTITVDRTHHPAIYEELDMSGNTRTKDLPYVNGTLAKFRCYAGAPLNTTAGIPIGTVCVMSHQPSSGLDAAKQRFLTDTASNVMRQLTLILQVLEGERLMQFQSATAAFLQRQRLSLHQQVEGLPRKHLVTTQQPGGVVESYQHAAEVMRRSLELEGVTFQHVSSNNRTPQTTSGNWQHPTIATSLSAGSSRPICLSHLEVDKILQLFPHGTILHRLDGDWLVSTLEGNRPLLDLEVGKALDKSSQSSKQLLIMPLFDVLHDRTAAICIGWLNDYSRVYLDQSDLLFVSAFCMSVMSEVLQLETQMLEQVKSDFVGSISHEMKTPLHQTLGDLELLLQTSCSDEQCELVVNARFGATQLLETIDKILQYSRTSSNSDAKQEAPCETDMILNEREAPLITGPRVEHTAGAASTVDLVRMCEEVVEDTTKRMRLLETIMSPSEQQDQDQDDMSRPKLPVRRADGTEEDPFTIVVFDASPIESVQIPRNTGFRIVLENLLV
jgi:signal transduction histidine kinase